MTEDNDDKLMQAARQLQTDIAPQRELWSGIAEAIETPEPRRWSPMLAQAATVLLLVGGSSAVTWLAMKDQQTTPTVLPAEMLFEQTSFGNSHQLGDDFQDARSALVAALNIELARLPLESRANIETNLNLIHDAIFDINKALQEEPGDTMLQEQLLRAYREELTLLRRVSGLSHNVMMRNDI